MGADVLQSTLPRGERPAMVSRYCAVSLQLQSTLPRGERLFGVEDRRSLLWLQSTLPRGERPLQTPLPMLPRLASIHAPARGATPSWRFLPGWRGASIHAPARGATRAWAVCPCDISCFNPRSRAGSDRRSASRCARSWKLQSTLPRGERQALLSNAACLMASFNPRSRAGSDLSKPPGSDRACASIHAPARGATHAALLPNAWMRLQSTLPRGERLVQVGPFRTAGGASIHAPARGATRTGGARAGRDRLQSTLPRGERHSHGAGHGAGAGASIHAPARGATS